MEIPTADQNIDTIGVQPNLYSEKNGYFFQFYLSRFWLTAMWQSNIKL